MKTGISIYLSSPLQDIERTIERGAAAGARYAFTSLHIPEDGGAAYADKVRHVLSLLSARGIALIADVGPRTCDLLGLERIEDLRDLGLEYLRLDYGFSAQRVAELSGEFRIVVNASTVSSDEIASWREAGADVTRFAACHNFYPKPYILHQIHQILSLFQFRIYHVKLFPGANDKTLSVLFPEYIHNSGKFHTHLHIPSYNSYNEFSSYFLPSSGIITSIPLVLSCFFPCRIFFCAAFSIILLTSSSIEKFSIPFTSSIISFSEKLR